MSDRDVENALRSDVPLVIVEAPAGFGKTYQAAEYVKYLVPSFAPGRLLILTHTNAACDVFAKRTRGLSRYVEIRTIDSLVIQIATIYHQSLGLPFQVMNWVRMAGENGFEKLGTKVADLSDHFPPISRALASRYPYIICDEHQDSNSAQHRIILAIQSAGSRTRIFGDPMQAIYTGRQELSDWERRWAKLKSSADQCVRLETPHRWKGHAPALGDWIKEARNALETGNPVDLRNDLPSELSVIRADNSARGHGQYRLPKEDRGPIDRFVNSVPRLLILSPHNDMVGAMRGFFNRRFPIWEGHTRYSLDKLILSCQDNAGDAIAITDALVSFVQTVTTGFTKNAYADILKREVVEQCSKQRKKKSAKIQSLAKCIIESPDHRGASMALALLDDYIESDSSFGSIKVDYRQELKDAIELKDYESPDDGLAEMAQRRTYRRTPFPSKVISTIHKAKGVEADNVLIMPCDRQRFTDSDAKRRLLYVALSRATRSLTLVVPKTSPSPLFHV